MANRLNLARRPFVDTRPVNVTIVLLAIAALFLSALSWSTVTSSSSSTTKTRAEIAVLRTDIQGLEDRKRAREAGLARFDIADLAVSAKEANAIAGLRAFSWTRFLTRLEETLPADARVVTIGLSRPDTSVMSTSQKPTGKEGIYPLQLVLYSKDPEGLPKLIRAFYGSPWFDKPTPVSEENQEKTKGVAWRYTLSVEYHDAGRKS